ncbi:hypothetical protein SLA_2327 [Streptomyces laurentii]|uniref:Uncharacterized protein n=1 Tax=Streptomyces laurentii TaxID=39478 RepID=A0A160NYN7_STRLU|nr:hypothetical protein SLA_2327 [Streptomyces laurentii]
MIQRQKAFWMGGTVSCRARATTKLPDQTTVASRASSTPRPAPFGMIPADAGLSVVVVLSAAVGLIHLPSHRRNHQVHRYFVSVFFSWTERFPTGSLPRALRGPYGPRTLLRAL